MRKIITDLDELRTEKSSWKGKRFAFDVETSGLSFRQDRLLGLALYFEDATAYYIVLEHTIPLWDGTVKEMPFISASDLRYELASIFSQDDLVMVAHNAKFDMHFLHKNSLFIQGRLFDTLLAAQLLNENRLNGLKDLAASMGFVYEKYTELGVYDGYKKSEILGVPLEAVAQYAMNDVEATWKLYEKFSEELASQGMEGVFNSIWMPLLPVLQQMESRGIALDIDLVHKIRTEYVEKRDDLERKVRAIGTDLILKHYKPEDIPKVYLTEIASEEDMENSYTREDGFIAVQKDGVEHPIITHDMLGKTKTYRPRLLVFNTGSSKQLQELVYQWSGVTVPTEIELKLTKTGYSVDKDNLETLIYFAKDDAPAFLRDVLDWRKADKFINTYLNRFINDADADDHYAISTNFSQAVGESGRGGTVTGRLASGNPNLNIRAVCW